MQLTHQPSGHLLTTSLSNGAQLFIFSIRQWLAAAQGKQCIHAVLGPFYHRYNAMRALPVMDELMCHLAATAYRPLQVNCPCRADVAEDELALLRTLQAVTRKDADVAKETLGTLVTGPLATTFLRVAKSLVDELQAANLELTGVRRLEVVQ